MQGHRVLASRSLLSLGRRTRTLGACVARIWRNDVGGSTGPGPRELSHVDQQARSGHYGREPFYSFPANIGRAVSIPRHSPANAVLRKVLGRRVDAQGALEACSDRQAPGHTWRRTRNRRTPAPPPPPCLRRYREGPSAAKHLPRHYTPHAPSQQSTRHRQPHPHSETSWHISSTGCRSRARRSRAAPCGGSDRIPTPQDSRPGPREDELPIPQVILARRCALLQLRLLALRRCCNNSVLTQHDPRVAYPSAHDLRSPGAALGWSAK